MTFIVIDNPRINMDIQYSQEELHFIFLQQFKFLLDDFPTKEKAILQKVYDEHLPHIEKALEPGLSQYRTKAILSHDATEYSQHTKGALSKHAHDLYQQSKQASKEIFNQVFDSLTQPQGVQMMQNLYSQLPGGPFDMFSNNSNRTGFDDMQSFCKLYLGVGILMLQLYLFPFGLLLLGGVKKRGKEMLNDFFNFKSMEEKLHEADERLNRASQNNFLNTFDINIQLNIQKDLTQHDKHLSQLPYHIDKVSLKIKQVREKSFHSDLEKENKHKLGL